MSQPIGPEAIYGIVGVGDGQLSPDGRRIIAVKSWTDKRALEGRSHLIMINLPDETPRPFTHGPRDGMPRWAPDGQQLAFVRADARDKRQVWVIPVDGGEARKVTDLLSGVFEYAWAPDGKQLVVSSDVDPDRLPEKHDPKKDPRVRVVNRIRYRQDTAGWRGDAHFHLFTVDIESGAATQITDGDWDDLSPVWSPDGTRIAFICNRRPERDTRSYTEGYVVPVAGGEPERWSGDLFHIQGLTWSPDSKKLAAVGSDDARAWGGLQGYVYVLERRKAPRRLTDDSIKPATGFYPVSPPPEMRWTSDGRIIFLADAKGQSFLCEMSAKKSGARKVRSGFVSSTMSLSADGQRTLVTGTTVDQPSGLLLWEGKKATPRRLTDFNADFLRDHPPARLEKFAFKRKGREIECRLWFPTDFDASKKYPLVLEVHGGPNGAYYDSFNLLQEMLATNGFLTLAVNPRGSTTYGNDFMLAVLDDWGGEDYQELMAAVDLVAKRPYVDSAHMGIHGYSYGGFMTTWAIGHTDRFRAAVAGAPCIDLPSMYGTSDIGVSFGEGHWGGTRDEGLKKYQERSPLTYASKVTTPLLLMHGDADYRVPIEQSEQYFVALKRHEKTVEFVRFPGCSHLFLRGAHPKLREEYYRRMLSWFDRYLKTEG